MGLPVLVLGESGTGKSASMRNFKGNEVAVINVAGKPLPFKNKIPSETTDDYAKITRYTKELTSRGFKTIVIDDAQYLMANEFMRRATERGFDKFTEIAQNFWSLVNSCKELPNDVVVYFMAHIERDANGNEKIKTIGKLLDEKITVEGMFTIVLKTYVNDGQYSFVTQNNGHDTVKSPIGMFPSYVIDNDLKYVDEKIRNYYELGEFLTDAEIAEIDEAAKKDDIPIKDEPKKRRGSRGKKEEEEPTEAPTEEKKEEAAEHPKRSRKKVSDDPERKAVEKENEEAIANHGATGNPDGEPFDSMPEVKEPPRRKKRNASADNKNEDDVEREETPTSIGAAEKPKRTRSRKTGNDEPAEATESQTTEETSEAPKRRRRRA